jgi:excinuclease ABC subunit C
MLDIKSLLKDIPQTSGIYQFLDEKDEVLYIGKAKNLKKRLASYATVANQCFQKYGSLILNGSQAIKNAETIDLRQSRYAVQQRLSSRTSVMISLAHKINFIQTKNEIDAIFLEHNLIKKKLPKYNILLRDDKTFASIIVTQSHDFPAIYKHRGKKNNDDIYFGPYISVLDVNKIIDIIKKIFLLRGCANSFFKTHQKQNRPCLEYQIKRCSGPCISAISKDDYKKSISDASDFLKGKFSLVQKKLTEKMMEFIAHDDRENADKIKNIIKSLKPIFLRQK